MTDQLTLLPVASPGPSFDERGIARWHDIDLMALTAIRLHNAGEHQAAAMAALLPGVIERIGELVDQGGYEWR